MKKLAVSLLGILIVVTVTFGSNSSTGSQSTINVIKYSHGHTGWWKEGLYIPFSYILEFNTYPPPTFIYINLKNK